MNAYFGKSIQRTVVLMLGMAYALTLLSGCTMWSKPSAGYTAAAMESSQKEEPALAEVYGKTVTGMTASGENFPVPTDRASLESDRN